MPSVVASTLFSLLAVGSAFQLQTLPGPASASRSDSVSMLAPWRVAATVGATAGGIAAGTYAVKQLMTKQSENEASKGRAALSAMGLGIDGSVLDEDAEEPFTVVGDWKRLIRRDGRVQFKHMKTGKVQWRPPDEFKEGAEDLLVGASS